MTPHQKAETRNDRFEFACMISSIVFLSLYSFNVTYVLILLGEPASILAAVCNSAWLTPTPLPCHSYAARDCSHLCCSNFPFRSACLVSDSIFVYSLCAVLLQLCWFRGSQLYRPVRLLALTSSLLECCRCNCTRMTGRSP